MKRLLFCILLLFVACSDKDSGKSDSPNTEQQKEQTVYITRTGHKYHRAGCKYLSHSSYAVSLSEAKRRYEPCSVCNPPR